MVVFILPLIPLSLARTEPLSQLKPTTHQRQRHLYAILYDVKRFRDGALVLDALLVSIIVGQGLPVLSTFFFYTFQ